MQRVLYLEESKIMIHVDKGTDSQNYFPVILPLLFSSNYRISSQYVRGHRGCFCVCSSQLVRPGCCEYE